MSDNNYAQGDQATIPVFVTNQLPPEMRDQYRSTYHRVLLEGVAQAETLVPASDTRVCYFVMPLDDDVCIDSNKSDAAAGTGAYIPKGTALPWPLQDSQTVYVALPAGATMAGAVSRVTVIDIHRVPAKSGR